ncbi:MAG: radical SAM protein [Proteobacteria bacterium]|nr:radical SAM protein [Pseudomonadota bacterium]MBU1738134.1 radical SAM protein [Pseudomonadota bacterium]
MGGRSAHSFFRPALTDLIPLPEGSELFVLEDRYPVGFAPDESEPCHLEDDPVSPGNPVQAVAAFMVPAHTAIYSAAFEKKDRGSKHLPLFAYTAVGWLDDRFWVAGFRSDADLRQEPGRFTQSRIKKATEKRLREYPKNRLVQHLGKCSLTYGCPAAVNYFMDSWEAPLPTAPACNARCIGCISLQPSGCCPATQDRIKFVPSEAEITEIGVGHLQRVKRGVVSFGQGCEGEPLTEAETIEEAIRSIRKKTATGTINLNSNSSRPAAVAKLAAAGLDSLRVSMNSAQDHYHHRYYRPKDFTFSEVKESIRIMKEADRFVSLNYFILPGFTDDPAEYDALCTLISEYKPDFIQLRNLNMDPDWYLEEIGFAATGEAIGILNWWEKLKKKFPELRFGYFNPPIK